ncbi:MAG: hypothetical protein FWG40_05495 [Peptococcaceae bacterium]|nr:hypothetical protein [Peptococcaceae bacterium]
MSKIRCRCNNVLSNIDAPNDIELIVYSDRQWENEINIGIINSIEIPSPKYNIWRCPVCDRIYVFEKGNDVAIKVYALEDEPDSEMLPTDV